MPRPSTRSASARRTSWPSTSRLAPPRPRRRPAPRPRHELRNTVNTRPFFAYAWRDVHFLRVARDDSSLTRTAGRIDGCGPAGLGVGEGGGGGDSVSLALASPWAKSGGDDGR